MYWGWPLLLGRKSIAFEDKPEVILSGRTTNDNMVRFIGKEIVKRLAKNSKCLFLGVTFKEDVPDLRNSKCIELMNFLKKEIKN